MPPRTFFAARFAQAFLATLIVAVIALAPVGAARADTQTQGTAVFDEAWRTVRDNFYDKTLAGLDWDKVGDTYREKYRAAKSEAERAAVINALIGELHASHMIYATPSEPSYYQLADIFSWGLRRDLPRYFPGGEVGYPGVGIMTRDIDGKTFVAGILAGLAGDKADLKVGDEIVAVDGAPFAPVASFRDKTGRDVTMTIRREAGGPTSEITLKPEDIKPGKAFADAMRGSARIIDVDGKKIGYIHVWSYAGQRYQSVLEEVLAEGALKDADALVWDLRDGWGGASPEFLDIFNARGPDLTMTERNGDKEYAGFKWRKPVVLLVNGGTRSGKEVLTYGFKKYGFGEVVGTRTAGALLAGRGYLLSDGSFLMVAVNDVAVDGERLEGKGVEPTIEVPFELPYAGGHDPQLDRAVEEAAKSAKG